MVMAASFRCINGAPAAACGYVNYKDTYRMDGMGISYDACARVTTFGVDTSASFLRLNSDVDRQTPVTSNVQASSTVYGRLSVQPTAGAVFRAVTLTSLDAWQQSAGAAATDLGNVLTQNFLALLSTPTNTNPQNPVWDFDLYVDPLFFQAGNVYYLAATVSLTFANTGPLSKRLVMQINLPNQTHSLRAQLADQSMGQIAPRAGQNSQPIYSNTMRMQTLATQGTVAVATSAPTSATGTGTGTSATTTSAVSSSGGLSDSASIAIGAALCALGIAVLLIVVVLVLRRKRQQQQQDSTYAPVLGTQYGASAVPLASRNSDNDVGGLVSVLRAPEFLLRSSPLVCSNKLAGIRRSKVQKLQSEFGGR
jgi:hypothetical protein